MDKKFVKICPKCKSTDVSCNLEASAYGMSSFFDQYKCNECGYSGQFFPEVEQKEVKKK